MRNQLQQHADAIRQTVLRKRFVMGLQRYSRAELERVVAAGEQLEIHVLGLATLEDDVTPELSGALAQQFVALTLVAVTASILVHGITVHPVMNWYAHAQAADPER